MHDRARRALAEIDARQLYLCPTCEGLLLAAAAGLPLPTVCDEDGQVLDGELYLDTMLDRIFVRSLRPVAVTLFQGGWECTKSWNATDPPCW
jgi:hypothetical protein